jgi:hypothetical protein
MLCGETVAVYSENRTEHKDTLWAVRTSQEPHHVTATEPNRLMLCGDTVAVRCENRTEHTDTLWAVRTSQEARHFFAGKASDCEGGRNSVTEMLVCDSKSFNSCIYSST